MTDVTDAHRCQEFGGDLPAGTVCVMDEHGSHRHLPTDATAG